MQDCMAITLSSSNALHSSSSWKMILRWRKQPLAFSMSSSKDLPWNSWPASAKYSLKGKNVCNRADLCQHQQESIGITSRSDLPWGDCANASLAVVTVHPAPALKSMCDGLACNRHVLMSRMHEVASGRVKAYRDAVSRIVGVFDCLEELLPSGQDVEQPEVGSSLACVRCIFCYLELLRHFLNLARRESFQCIEIVYSMSWHNAHAACGNAFRVL